ncbi:MAG TPA: peptide chain release factor N(5)-glutamine methyltransferase, partial [Devosia sp.]|nr:peptide chain release factor N(5)-glutamine methyltransferase [Devosia sp.]
MDARLLVGHALGLDDVQLVCSERELVSIEDIKKIDHLLARRLDFEPVARILGSKEFYGLDFALNEATLIPRPETEMLVDRALEFFSTGEKSSFLELGSGTGCISIAIVNGAEQVNGTGVDVSARALECARANAKNLGVTARMNFVHGSWYCAVGEKENFDLIVSNPPYIKEKTI